MTSSAMLEASPTEQTELMWGLGSRRAHMFLEGSPPAALALAFRPDETAAKDEDGPTPAGPAKNQRQFSLKTNR